MDVISHPRIPSVPAVVESHELDGDSAVPTEPTGTAGRGLLDASDVIRAYYHYNDAAIDAAAAGLGGSVPYRKLSDNDAATCNDHHCRAHWTECTARYIDASGYLRS